MRQSNFEKHATTILVRERARTTSLDHLFRALTRRFGPIVSGPEELRNRLSRNPERFLILDPPGPPAGSATMPESVREAHDAALESAGLAPRPQITLVGPAELGSETDAAPTSPGSDADFSDPMLPLINRLDTSICALAGETADDPTLADALAEALRETRDLQHAFSSRPGP